MVSCPGPRLSGASASNPIRAQAESTRRQLSLQAISATGSFPGDSRSLADSGSESVMFSWSGWCPDPHKPLESLLENPLQSLRLRYLYVNKKWFLGCPERWGERTVFFLKVVRERNHPNHGPWCPGAKPGWRIPLHYYILAQDEPGKWLDL